MGASEDSLSLRQYGASHDSHAHSHFQVLLGLEGVLELEVQGRSQRIAAGQGCVIAPGEQHDFEARHGSRCLVLDTAQAGWAFCPPAPAQAAQAVALARYLALALEQDLTQAGSLARRYGPGLLLQAWRPAQGPTGALPSQRCQRPIDWAQLGRWTDERLHQALSVTLLAQQVFLSPSQFAARCRRETGMSVMQWLRHRRLAQARALRAAGMGVADTAIHCGYQSPSALTAALRRPPTQ